MKELTIHGKKIRTNNSRIQEIMELWSEVMPLQLDGDLYAIYYNYESNHLGDYDFLIGTNNANLMDTVVLSSTNYLEVQVEDNKIENVGKTWQKIWQNVEIEAKRTYEIDFEKYSKDGTIKIYLSVK